MKRLLIPLAIAIALFATACNTDPYAQNVQLSSVISYESAGCAPTDPDGVRGAQWHSIRATATNGQEVYAAYNHKCHGGKWIPTYNGQRVSAKICVVSYIMLEGRTDADGVVASHEYCSPGRTTLNSAHQYQTLQVTGHALAAGQLGTYDLHAFESYVQFFKNATGPVAVQCDMHDPDDSNNTAYCNKVPVGA